MVTAATSEEPGKAAPTAAARRVLTRPWSAGLVLLLAYVALSFLTDTGGTLGTDTGIKVATLTVMGEHGTVRPDIGYWAAPWDPDAVFHGYRDTKLIGGQYVDVSTLPMIVAAYPLWRVGGYRLALLLPMLGAVAAAFVARGLARRLDAGADGWSAFWLVGLASPLVLYALDLWEHTIGVALMGGAVLLVLAVVQAPASPGAWRGAALRGLGAGALCGAAYTMRTEAVAYTVTTFAIGAVVLLWRRRPVPAIATGVAGVAGFVAVAAANVGLELALVGQTIRSARAAGASGLGGSDLGLRAREALVTSTSPFPSFDDSYLVIGVVMAAALVGLAVVGRDRRRRPWAVVCTAVVVLVALDRLSLGPGFWPGLLATTPIAAIALASGWRRPDLRLGVLFALVPMPLVFWFQFSGGALPQWGGRYLLTSGFLLLTVGSVLLPTLERWVQVAFVALSILVTVVGVSWLVQRTHEVARAGEALVALPEPVLISPESFPPREFAATYGRKDWLSTTSVDDLPAAADLVAESGRDSFAVVTIGDRPLPDLPGFRATTTTTIPFVSPTELHVTSFVRTPPG